jgi:hypothetical protein
MARSLALALVFLIGSIALGATVFREQIASATGVATPTVPVAEQNLDTHGLGIRVHEQGTANVNVTNPSLQISGLPSVKLDPTGNTVKLDPANSAVSLGTTDGGHLAGIDQATGKLSFDGAGSLKTAPQGTQNVNITGGSLSATPAVANWDQVVNVDLRAQETDEFRLLDASGRGATVDVAMMYIEPEGSIRVFATLPASGDFTGPNFDLVQLLGGDNDLLTFNEPIPMTSINVGCKLLNDPCQATISMVGRIER